MVDQYNGTTTGSYGIGHFFVRLLVGAIVLAITAALTPGFSITGIWPLIFAAAVLAGLDYLSLRFLGINASPFGRGIAGFLMAAVIIYLTKFFVPAGYSVSWVGAIIGALVYGIVDAIIPGRAM